MDNQLEERKRKIILTAFYSLNILFAILIITSFLINSKVLLFISISFLFLLSILNFARIIILKETTFSKVFGLIFIAFYSILMVFLIFHFYNFAFATNVIKYSMYLVLLIASLLAGIGGSEKKFFNNTDPVIFAVVVMILPIIYFIIKTFNLWKKKY